MNRSEVNENKRIKKERLMSRITELDLFRGIAVLLMIFDHLMFDLWGFMPDIIAGFPSGVIEFAQSYWQWDIRVFLHFTVVFVFLALTGISCSFSRSNLKRGVKLMGVALLMTLGTYLFGLATGNAYGSLIVFGVLHMIAFTIILISVTELISENKWVYLAMGIVLIVVGVIIADPVNVPSANYGDGNFFELFFEAFIGKILLGPDCFSFFFYGGQIFIGVFLGKLLYPERKPLLFKKGYKNNFVTFVGRHALVIYFFHQIVIPVVLGIVFLILGYGLNIS